MRKSHQDFKAIDEDFARKEKEEEMKNSMALVPVTFDNQKKARNELLKMKAKALGGGSTKAANGNVLFDIDAEGDTFVTGVGIPGKKTKKGKMVIFDPTKEDEENKFYAFPEDELMERVDKTEREMKEMMNYLNAVDDMMGGDDLAQIKKMLKYTSSSV